MWTTRRETNKEVNVHQKADAAFNQRNFDLCTHLDPKRPKHNNKTTTTKNRVYCKANIHCSYLFSGFFQNNHTEILAGGNLPPTSPNQHALTQNTKLRKSRMVFDVQIPQSMLPVWAEEPERKLFRGFFAFYLISLREAELQPLLPSHKFPSLSPSALPVIKRSHDWCKGTQGKGRAHWSSRI